MVVLVFINETSYSDSVGNGGDTTVSSFHWLSILENCNTDFMTTPLLEFIMSICI